MREALSEFIARYDSQRSSGYGRQQGKTEIYRGAEYEIHFLPKIKIEIAVEAKTAKKVVEAIKAAAHTDKIGDGKIFVIDMADAVRIRTGETGSDALGRVDYGV